MPSVQDYIKEFAIKELKSKLQTNLGIESVNIQPFNTILLKGVYLNDKQDSTILSADKIYAKLDIKSLLNKQLIISAAKLSDFNIYLSKDSASAPLNIQFVLDAFKSKNDSSQNKLDVQINSINIADGNFHFDVKNRPYISDKFDPNHISVSGLNAKLSLKSLRPDSLNIQIKKLELKEKSGLVVNNLIARFLTQNGHLSVKGFRLALPKSILQFDKCEIDYQDFRIPAELINNARFDAKISASSYITFNDIAAFVPAFKHFQDRILFKTEINGKPDSIRIVNIALDYGEKMHLSGKGFISNLGQKDKIFVQGSIDKLTISEEGIIGLINNFSKDKRTVPPLPVNLGDLSFQGSVSGYLKEMKANGVLGSNLGIVNANATFGLQPNNQTDFFFDGKVNTTDFHLGKLIDNNEIENISFDLTANVTKPKFNKINGNVEGIINSFTFKKYTYNDIKIDGKYDGLILDGKLAVNDENGNLKIDGLFDLSDSQEPKLNFKAGIKNVRLDKLNLSNKYKESYLSLLMDANFIGKTIDDLHGYIKTDSIRFLLPNKSLKMDNLLIQASEKDSVRELNIQSDIITGKVTGAYSFSTIAESIKRTLHNYLPALIGYTEKKNKKIKENNLNFDFTISNTENLSDVFGLPIIIYTPSRITGLYNNENEHFKIETFLPSFMAAGSKIQSGYLSFENTDELIKSVISGSFVTKNGTINDLKLNITAKDDIINIHSLFLNKDETRLKGEFSNSVTFTRNTDDNSLLTSIHFKPGELVLNNSLWKIYDSYIGIKGNSVNVNNFKVNNSQGNQELTINGTYSPKDENETLNLVLQNIDLEYIFRSLAIKALEFGGGASGTMAVSSIKGQPYADVNLNVSNFAFNNTNLGHLLLYSNLDNKSLKVNLKGSITNENNKLTLIDGFINPITQELSINFDSEEVNVAFLNKYVETLFNGVKGKGKGNVHLFGNFSNVTVEGEAFVENGSIGVNFLNTNYSFTDTIYMKKDLIYFSDVSFHDEKGNTAVISGRVAHDFFSNFMYFVNLAGNNFLVYNVTEKMNPMFYGTIFGTGNGVIKGDEKVVDINMRLKTEPNTNVYMNFMEETAAEYSFVTYKTKDNKNDSITTSPERFKPGRIKTDSGIEMNMDFYIDATPDASVEFLMDPVGGDKLKGSGSGGLQFTWGTSKDPMLYGTYLINKGSYNFTFQKIMERKFIIQENSSVQFRGDPFQANIDITAIYRVMANLNDLDRNLALSTGQTNVPVNCVLDISGPLKQPAVKLNVELPSADPEVQRQVKSLMSTEDMINRQIVYLLLLSKFYTPNYAVTDHKTSDLAAVASATLSTQLSKILSQIDDRWQIGTNIRTSDSGFSNTEVELILSSRLMNDRVLLNGNFGYRDNMETPDAFIGDIDIEVLLNRMGTWRLKAYNHYNEKYYYVRNGGSVQTQGIGIVYKKDFDNLKELFTRPKKTKVPPPDTMLEPDNTGNDGQFVKMKK